MFARRRSEERGVSSSTDRYHARLRGIAIMLLQAFKNHLIQTSISKSEQICEAIEGYVEKLQVSNSIEVLDELEQSIKHLIRNQQKQEELRKAQRISALRELVAAAANGLSELTRDSQQFSDRVSEHLQGLAVLASADELEEIKKGLQQEIPALERIVAAKQSRDRQLTEDVEARIQMLEEQLAEANAQLTMDSLTQVHNRRAFDHRLVDCVKQQTTWGGCFALVMFDIDHFKQVNDVHGHQVGDLVLQALARMATENFRTDDFVARYGGEEFAVILSDSGELYASKAAERFRLAIANRQFKYQRAEQINTLRLTVSVGISVFRPGDSPASLVERADKALYLAKHSGRNQVKTEAHLTR